MKNINILVVDDNKDLVVTMKNFFDESSNIRIKYEAYDGETALQLILSKKDDYDLILIDPLISKKDGLTIFEEMQERKIKKQVFILSSYKDSQILERSNDFNICGYLLKPFDLNILEKRINSYFNENALSIENEQISLKKKITKIIHELGVPSNLNGYNYIRDGIMMVYYNPSLSSKITKGLYPEIAKMYDSNDSRVERSMRHAIEVSWNRGNWDMMEEIFGYSVSIDKAKPTNSEFIVTIADMLRLQSI